MGGAARLPSVNGMTTEPRTRPGRDRDRRRRSRRPVLAASAATLAYVLLGGHHDAVELPADAPSGAARGSSARTPAPAARP